MLIGSLHADLVCWSDTNRALVKVLKITHTRTITYRCDTMAQKVAANALWREVFRGRQLKSNISQILDFFFLPLLHVFSYLLTFLGFRWWQAWPSGESTCLPPIWPEFDFRTRHHMWIKFVGSLVCYKSFFPGYYRFPLSSKTSSWFDLTWFDLWNNNNCKIVIWAMLIWFPLEL